MGNSWYVECLVFMKISCYMDFQRKVNALEAEWSWRILWHCWWVKTHEKLKKMKLILKKRRFKEYFSYNRYIKVDVNYDVS